MNRTPEVPEEDEEVNPSASALIEALRSFGYSVSTSIADLLDNSISAGASVIDVDLRWAGPNTIATIRDDGRGMSEEELRDAMRAGSRSPLEERSPEDLGRFGLGLKTASFSQARSLTVVSKQKRDGPIAVRRWDLDHVQATDRWSLLKSATEQGLECFLLLDDFDHGTLVIWEKLDRIIDDRPADDEKARATFLFVVDEVRHHLEMVFHRIMKEDGLKIRVNDCDCVPWDPFMVDHPKTEPQPDESRDLTVAGGATQRLTIKPYVLPHNRNLTPEQHSRGAGPRGWNLQQGHYLYRARRLIVAGDWFSRGLKPEEHYKLGRVLVEITQDMDSEWDLDVRKSRARPPALLRDEFIRVSRATRARAQEVYRTLGKRAVGKASRTPVVPVWLVTSDQENIRYEINRKHQHIARMLDKVTGQKKRSLRAVLSLVERNVPVAHILSQGFSDEQSLGTTANELSDELLEFTQEIFDGLCDDGNTEEHAKEILLAQQPFANFPEVINALEKKEQE